MQAPYLKPRDSLLLITILVFKFRIHEDLVLVILNARSSQKAFDKHVKPWQRPFSLLRLKSATITTSLKNGRFAGGLLRVCACTQLSCTSHRPFVLLCRCSAMVQEFLTTNSFAGLLGQRTNSVHIAQAFCPRPSVLSL